jgi:hypothetical protein
VPAATASLKRTYTECSPNCATTLYVPLPLFSAGMVFAARFASETNPQIIETICNPNLRVKVLKSSLNIAAKL